MHNSSLPEPRAERNRKWHLKHALAASSPTIKRFARRRRTESLAEHDLLDEPSRVGRSFDSDVRNVTDGDARIRSVLAARVKRGQNRIRSKSEIDRKRKVGAETIFGSRREKKLWRFLSPLRFLLESFLEHNQYINHSHSTPLIMHY